MIRHVIMKPEVASEILHELKKSFPDKDPYYYQQGLCELYQRYVLAAPEYTRESARIFMSELLFNCGAGVGDFWDNTIPFDQSDTVQFASSLAGNDKKYCFRNPSGDIVVKATPAYSEKMEEVATAKTLADAIMIGRAYRDAGRTVKLVRVSNDEDITRALDLPQEKFKG